VGFIWPNVYQGNINLPLLVKIMKKSAAFQALSNAISGDAGFSKATVSPIALDLSIILYHFLGLH
jgi:hypothetical protein